MTLLLRDDAGTVHPVSNVTQTEMTDFAQRAWKRNLDLAREYDLLPDPVCGLRKLQEATV
jgi:hypothetical protein